VRRMVCFGSGRLSRKFESTCFAAWRGGDEVVIKLTVQRRQGPQQKKNFIPNKENRFSCDVVGLESWKLTYWVEFW
jgi:hypothetical protein